MAKKGTIAAIISAIAVVTAAFITSVHKWMPLISRSESAENGPPKCVN